jgi:ferric-dicitrate binding protein FerR (iron transport regulator)
LGVSNSVVLDAGQAVQIVNNRIAERWDITSDQPEWMSGVSSFRNVSLRVVLSEIERQFDINIDYSEVNVNSIITSNFPHEDLERALRIVLTPVDIQYQIVDDKNVRLLPE